MKNLYDEELEKFILKKITCWFKKLDVRSRLNFSRVKLFYTDNKQLLKFLIRESSKTLDNKKGFLNLFAYSFF